jgi:phosphoribosyl 1,2-cyclic phosphodiesterase
MTSGRGILHGRNFANMREPPERRAPISGEVFCRDDCERETIHMTRFCALYSGSSGNCAYIESGGRGVLIDAGVSLRAIRQAVESIGGDMSRLSAVFITHEHSDHIRGLAVLASKYGVPIYANRGTSQGILEVCPRIVPERLSLLETGCCVETEDMCVESFPTSHDSRESVGYHIVTSDGHSLTVATDLGCVGEDVMAAALGSELVMLESNHDIGMLETGRYPYFLKRRILSDHGHLSNNDCAETLTRLAESGTKHFILAHLSRDNNLPELAEETSKCALTALGAERGRDYTLEAAPRSCPGILYEL